MGGAMGNSAPRTGPEVEEEVSRSPQGPRGNSRRPGSVAVPSVPELAPAKPM